MCVCVYVCTVSHPTAGFTTVVAGQTCSSNQPVDPLKRGPIYRILWQFYEYACFRATGWFALKIPNVFPGEYPPFFRFNP